MSLLGPDDIGVHIQQEDWCTLVGIGLFHDPARFCEPKPRVLHEVPDDSWAALILRVDPLARKILEPRRSFIGAFLLFIIITTVFSTIRPTVRLSELDSYDDEYGSNVYDDFYAYQPDDDGSDDVLMAEMQYRKIEIASELRTWGVSYVLIIAFLFFSTVALAVMMERRNRSYDEKIRNVCAEIGTRFQSAGISIEYRTHHNMKGCRRYWVQERAIVFHLSEEAQQSYKPAEIPANDGAFRSVKNGQLALEKFWKDQQFLDINASMSTSGELLGVPYLPQTSDDESD